MTNRNSTSTSWATDVAAQVVDPETDSSHPSGKGGAGKTAKGWVSETEPQQWENFNIKLREDRQWAILKNGRVPWDDEVTYKKGAITYLSSVLYVAIATSGNLNKSPATQTAYWSPIKFTTADLHATTIADMTNKYNIHAPAGQNSHNDNIVAIGGSIKSTIDNQNTVVANDLAAHIPLTNPHTDAATNIGTLPSTGGSFTGGVNYLDNMSIGTDCELMPNATTFVNFRSNTGAIGLGVADYHKGGRWQQILTALNFPDVESLYNSSFVMPKPDLHFPLLNSLAAMNSVPASLVYTRAGTLAYTDRNNVAQTAAINAPPYEVAGLKLGAGTALIVTASGLFGARDGCISYTLNNVVVVKDVQFTSADLTYYFGVSGNVKNFRVWSQRLTPRQKLSIPC